MADQPTDRYPNSEGPFAGPNNTFPMNTAARVRNAWARIHQDPTMANHTAAEVADIKGKIAARAKEMGIALEDQSVGASRAQPISENVERRVTHMMVELRTIPGTDGSREIGGYAAVFNRPSRNITTSMGRSFVERVAPPFFDESRSQGWPGNGGGVVARYNHNDNYLLGSTRSGTLRLAVDKTGLDYTADLPECRSDVLEYISRGDAWASSFTFVADEEGGCEWRHTPDGITERTLLRGTLIDVAPVGGATAAYPDATVALRSLAAFKEVPEEDVFALARSDELRKLFVRTDTGPPTPDPVEPPTDPAPEPTPEPVVEAAAPPESPEPSAAPAESQAPEQPSTISWQEAHLYLLSRRPFDPIVVK